MTKGSAPKELAVLMAAYDDRQVAENEWTALLQMIRAGEFDVDDAAVVESIDGKVGIVHNLHHPVRRGFLIGSLLVVLGPVGLVVGAVGGALGGKAADVMRAGLSRKAIDDLGRFVQENQVMIVLTGQPAVLEAIGSTMTEATRTVVDVVHPDATEVHAAAPEPDA